MVVLLLAAHKIIKTESLSLDVQHLGHLIAKLRLGEAEEIDECCKGGAVGRNADPGRHGIERNGC